jgi:hypothetical protein
MTAYCLSSTSRSRPLAFMFMAAGGERHPLPEQPVPPTHSVDTPDDEGVDDQPNPGDPGPPLLRPSRKRVPDEERGIP